MANTLLQQYFPLIRTREEILKIIHKNKRLLSIYRSWNVFQQRSFLDFCTGARGVNLLQQSVTIVQVLPNNDTRLTDENSLLILDILVELQDGSLANIECQKIGYDFPGERCACYSADLLLRQYIRIRSEKSESQQRFTYRDVKSVYTIVFLEKSTLAFHRFPTDYVHHFRQTSDTGLELNMLQEFVIISLDNFARIRQNKDVNTFNQLEAWMTFLSTDEPEVIIELITHFPEFKPLYEDIYDLCLNIEQVIHMYSKELQQLDTNTVHFMMEQMQASLAASQAEIVAKDNVIAAKDSQIAAKDSEIAELKRRLALRME